MELWNVIERLTKKLQWTETGLLVLLSHSSELDNNNIIIIRLCNAVRSLLRGVGFNR